MYVDTLKLINFRNYEEVEITFSSGINIIYGLNGQGKTNILEAINFCAMGSSFRTNKTKELMKWEKNILYVGCTIQTENTKKIIEITQKNNEKKSVKINKISIRKMEELLGNLKIVSFTPDDLKLITGSPSERRKFIDNLISQLNPKYYRILMNYNKAVDERNLLLKQVQNDKNILNVIDAWNERVIEYGSYLVFERNKVLNKINVYSQNASNKITNNQENVNIKYYCNILLNYEVDDIKQRYKLILEKNLNEDIRKGITNIGPHRDDINIFMGDIDVKAFGSQGQKRTAALSLKLSEVDIIKEEYGEYPIILLDDVMSELDIKRQNYLIENFEGIQIMVTCTNIDFFKKINNKSYFEVSRGTIKKM